MVSDKARILSQTPNNTTTFLRGDNTWSDTITDDLSIGGNLDVTGLIDGQTLYGVDLKYSGAESTTDVNFDNTADIVFSLAGFVRGVDDTTSTVIPSAGYLPLTGGTMTGSLIASNSTSTRQVRNITYSTTAPTASDGEVGDIWLVYEL